MKRYYVQSLSHQENIKLIKKTGTINRDGSKEPISIQLPGFSKIPLTYCSYIDENYNAAYSDNGIVFETIEPVVYASPVDTWVFLRGGEWLPGHEQFIFNTLEEMLKKYPKQQDFKKDFQKYFSNLTPEQVHPYFYKCDKPFAISKYELDFVLKHDWIDKIECNEITFKRPLNITLIATYSGNTGLNKIIKDLK